MHSPIDPYLALLRKELATSLKPTGEGNAKKVAGYSQLFLTQLLLRSKTLPALHRRAVRELDCLLDELNTELRSIDAAMVLAGDLTQHIRNDPDFILLEPVLQRATGVLLVNPSATRENLLQRISSILFEMQESLHQAALKEEAALKGASEAIENPPLNNAQIKALRDYLRRRFPAESALEIGALKAIVGGASKMTVIMDLLNVRQLPDTVVLRADKAGGVVESTVSDEYQLIETLYGEGMPVPRPFVSEPDASVIGSPFVVLSCIEGRNIGDNHDIHEPSESFGLSLARAMGKMHQIPPERFGDKIPGAKSTTQEWLRKDIATFEAVWRNSGQPSIALEMAYAWLKDHMQFAEGRRALNHCDIGCHNMLAKDGQLTGLLDWETVIIGNPAQDLAYVQTLVVQMMQWEDFLAEYERAGGTIPSANEFTFYRLWVAVWKITFVFVARSFFHSGISDSALLAYATQYLYQRHEHELHSILNDLYARR